MVFHRKRSTKSWWCTRTHALSFVHQVGDTDFFDIIAVVLQGDTLAPFLFIICLEYVLRTSAEKIKNLSFILTKSRSSRHPAITITDADYANDVALMSNTITEAQSPLLHSLETAAGDIGRYVNAGKTEFISYNQTGSIKTLNGKALKSVNSFTYLGRNIASTETDAKTRIGKAWSALDVINAVWKSSLPDDIKRDFFQAAVETVLVYDSPLWTLIKKLEAGWHIHTNASSCSEYLLEEAPNETASVWKNYTNR